MKSKSEVLARLAACIRLKGQIEGTVDSYCRVAGKFYDFALTCPPDWPSERKAEAYLSLRHTRDGISASTQNHDLAALNALYASMGKQLGNVDALRAKRPVSARHCPTTAELRALLGELHDTPQVPARLLALLMAGAGLRIGEAIGARLKDFRRDGERLHLVVRAPKHGHDRLVPIPPLLHAPLRVQAEYARLVFRRDQARAQPLPIQTPTALARKYPRAPHTIGWMFLFPSPNPMAHPRTGQPLRWHLPDYDVQHAFARACDALEAAERIFARITPHCLRHWFGTYFAGDVRDLQEIMGHKSLETTQGYRHPQLDRAVSPLETMAPALALA